MEELILQRSDPNLSINEVHLIETVRKGKNRSLTISEIAAELRRAVPSVTVAVNKLVDKGYLIKEKNIEDARSYQVKLTRKERNLSSSYVYSFKACT